MFSAENVCGLELISSITKMRESCLAEFDAHWQCLEKNNQVSRPSIARIRSELMCDSTSRPAGSLSVHLTTVSLANWWV
jgi:hypothetical protein